MAIEAGHAQQGEGALAHVKQEGAVAEDAGQRQVVAQQRQQDAVADAVEQALVLVPLQVVGDLPDIQVHLRGGASEQAHVHGVGARLWQLQPHDVALAAQWTGAKGL